MAWNLNPNIAMESGNRLLVEKRPVFNDAETEMTVSIEMRTAGGTNYLICRRFVTVRNGPGKSDKLMKNTPPVGGDHGDRLRVEENALTLAADIVATLSAAFDSGGSANAKRDALMTALVAADVVDEGTLPGS